MLLLYASQHILIKKKVSDQTATSLMILNCIQLELNLPTHVLQNTNPAQCTNDGVLVIFLKIHNTHLRSPVVKKLVWEPILLGTYFGNHRTKLSQSEYLRDFWEEWDIPGKCPD